MKYYKYIDLDYTLSANLIKSFVFKNRRKFTEFWNNVNTIEILSRYPEIKKMFSELNINIKKISIIVTDNTLNNVGIHRDVSEKNVRINIPVLNCEKSITNFYISKIRSPMSYLKNGVAYEKINYEDCELVDSFCLNRPAAIRVTELHQVIANSEFLPRISATIEFIENIDYLLD